MFTGIIEKKEAVVSAAASRKNTRVVITRPTGWKFALGDSVAVNGVCSTVVAQTKKNFAVEYMPQTLNATTAQLFISRSEVNLERSLRFGDRVHGHLVQGHVSSVGKVERVDKVGGKWEMTVSIAPHERVYVVPRGSLTIDGVSLTVAEKTKTGARVAIIPHTLTMTTLGSLKKGSKVNIETDFLIRAFLQK